MKFLPMILSRCTSFYFITFTFILKLFISFFWFFIFVTTVIVLASPPLPCLLLVRQWLPGDYLTLRLSPCLLCPIL